MIHIFILCYNEENIIETTIKHYQRMFPSCTITICDNESTDKSVEIAKKFKCKIHTYKTDGKVNDFVYNDIKENLWREAKTEWVLICDMDEFLCVNEDDLMAESLNGTTLINTQGYSILGDSHDSELKDISLENIHRGYKDDNYSKIICFKREEVERMNYNAGAHICSPHGRKIIFSSIKYSLYHFKYLGFPYLLKNFSINYQRSHEMRNFGMALHYTDDEQKIRNIMTRAEGLSHEIKPLVEIYKEKSKV